MAKRPFNTMQRYIGFVERASTKGIVAKGQLDGAGDKIIPAETVSQSILNKLTAGITFPALLSHDIAKDVYIIVRLYDYKPETPVNIVISNLSKIEEVSGVLSQIVEFLNSNNIIANIEGINRTLEKAAVTPNSSVTFSGYINFEYISQLLSDFKFRPVNYYIEVMSKEELSNKIADIVDVSGFFEKSLASIYSPITYENIEDDNYVMSDALSFLATQFLKDVVVNNENIVVGFAGDSGNGKTAAAKAIVNYLNRTTVKFFEFVKINIPAIMRPTDFFLQTGIKDGTTYDEYTRFHKAITEGNAVILIDEANRATPDNLNVLLGLIDDSEPFFIKGKDYRIAKNIIFIFTYNEGHQYTGTYDMDAALKSRMNVKLGFDMPSKDVLTKIVYKQFPEFPAADLNALIFLLYELRNASKAGRVTVDASIRALKNWCRLYAKANYVRALLPKVLDFAIVNFAESDEEKALIVSLIKEMLGKIGD